MSSQTRKWSGLSSLVHHTGPKQETVRTQLRRSPRQGPAGTSVSEPLCLYVTIQVLGCGEVTLLVPGVGDDPYQDLSLETKHIYT
jgi:hypothetical protein